MSLTLHDELLLTGFTMISLSIQVVGAFSMAIAINYLYFNKKNKD